MRCLLLFLLLLIAPLAARAQDPLPPNYAPLAQAYIVLDLDSGRVLYSKNPDQRLYPASLTKTMTCLVAYDHGQLAQGIRVGKDAATTGESSVYLIEGEVRTLDQLLHAAMIRSANDACVAMADGVGGSVPHFVEMMNANAKALGLKNTHFVNPHGLHDPQHYTSARDMATIARAFAQVPYLSEVVRQKAVVLPGNAKNPAMRVFPNRNKLLFRWSACDGLKTGSTKEAGHCLIATATQRDSVTGQPWRLVSVVLKSKGNNTYLDSQWLLQKAFATFHPQPVVQANQTLWSGDVKGGAFPLEAVTSRAIALPLRADEKASLSTKVELLNLQAPIKRGQTIGRANFFVGSKLIASLPVQARADVPQSLLARAVPGVGQAVFGPSPVTKAAWLGAICALSAILWRKRRARKKRRRATRHARTQPAFQPLDPHDLQRRS